MSRGTVEISTMLSPFVEFSAEAQSLKSTQSQFEKHEHLVRAFRNPYVISGHAGSTGDGFPVR
jgi:hypothetical protein